MFNCSFRLSKAFILTVLSFVSIQLFAQKAGLEVTRCSAIDRNISVRNITVDALGRKWGANSKGVYQIKASDLGTLQSIPVGDKNVLTYKGGNADFTWKDDDFKKFVKKPCSVISAWYDAKNDLLWLGTDEAGVFQFKTKPQMQLVENLTAANSKLKSDQINIIFQDKNGRMWIGCESGVMYGNQGKWKYDLTDFPVSRVREYGTVIYALADGDISKAPNGEKWSDLSVLESKTEGLVRDFDISSDGKMWLVSGVLTRFDLLTNTYDVFGGPEYYTSQYGNSIAVDQESAVWVGTDDKGMYLVDKASSMTVNAEIEEGIQCDGNGKDATAVVKVTGGLAPYTYQWSGGLSGSNPKNIAPGNYSVSVTDSKGKGRTAQLSVPDTRMKVTIKQKKSASGPGKSDGVAVLELEGNASGIQVLWDNGETMVQANTLTPGVHTVMVTNQKGCKTTGTVTIVEKTDPLFVSVTERSKLRCSYDKITLNLDVQGGKRPYGFQWSDPEIKGINPTNVTAGTYTVTITDANKATATATVTLAAPPIFEARAVSEMPASFGKTDGIAKATINGGSAPFAYVWDNEETSPSALQLSAGVHTFTVTDGVGCTASASVTIAESVATLSVAITEQTKIKCAGDAAIIMAVVKGGKPPFQYQWNNNAGVADIITNLQPGEYHVTVTDGTGTTSTSKFAITAIPVFEVTVKADAPASTGNSDGKASVVLANQDKHSFKWDNGETTAQALKLAPGTHRVTVTNPNGCAANGAITINENILPLSASISERIKIPCNGGTTALTVQVSGGKPPYKYQWNNTGLNGDKPSNVNAGDYFITVTDATGTNSTATFKVDQPPVFMGNYKADAPASTGNADGKASVILANGLNHTFKWDNGENGQQAVKLSPGTHSVTVTDPNGCTTNGSVLITENILTLSALVTEKGKIKCNGDKTGLLAQVSGGKPPYKYQWNNGILTGDKPDNVTAGMYLLTVTDAVGAVSTATVNVEQPANFVVTGQMDSPASANNADAKATVNANGGTTPYSYSWDSGERSATASKLNAGNHQVTVADANGCTSIVVVAITENILTLTVALTEKTKIKCASDKATLFVKVSGGKAPFNYAWSSPTISGEQAEGVGAGSYAVTVTDAKGASQTAKLNIVAPETLEASVLSSIGVASETSNDGKAKISVKGGTAPYSILWDNKQTGTTATKLNLGKHTVTVKDANGCSETLSIETTQRAMPELTKAIADGQTIRMKLLNFDTDKSELKSESLSMLDELYDFLSENPKVAIEVGGHTNNLPTDEFADKLSTARAKSVADYLTGKGIDAARVLYKGYGKRLPVASNLNPEGRKTNQRVEIKILRGR